MVETGSGTDMGIGLGVTFAACSLVGAATMYLAADQQLLAGWAFALAVVTGGLAIVAIQVYAGR